MVEERLTAYCGADPHHVHSDLEDIIEQGCTGIVFCMSETDFDLVPGRIEATIEGAGKVGLDVYLDFWGLGGCFATNRIPSKYLCFNPDVCRTGFDQSRRLDTEDNTEVPRGCINNPKFLEWIRAFTSKIIAAYPAKGVFWDEPKHGYCRCRYCQARFEQHYSDKMPEAVDARVEAMFNENVTEFLIMLFENARDTAAVQNMLCFMTTTQAELGAGNVAKLLNSEALDIYGTDPYWISLDKDFAWLRSEIEKVLDVCREYRKRSHIWIQCHAIPAGREHEVYEATLETANCEPDIIAAWGYKGMNSDLRADNPEQCWDELGRAYRQIKNA